jgi:hypothetical protein
MPRLDAGEIRYHGILAGFEKFPVVVERRDSVGAPTEGNSPGQDRDIQNRCAGKIT